MKAGEICNRQVVIARRDDTLLHAVRLMRDYHVGDVVVVDESDGRRVPAGLLTDRDIAVGVVAQDPERIGSLLVGDVLTKEVITARVQDDVADLLNSMTFHGIRRLPIVNDEGSLEGIVTLDDILELISEELASLVKIVTLQQKREAVRRSADADERKTDTATAG
jgi:CBS domain-containing protein